MNLDFSDNEFKKLLNRTGEIIINWKKRLAGERIYHNHSPKEIRAIFDEGLPEIGMPTDDLLNIIEKDVFDHSNFNPSPNYYGYITGGGNQVSILAETLKSALNQNNLKWHSAPANSEIEKITIKWICEFIGYPSDAGGVYVSGGSVANFLNIAVMRKMKSKIDVANDGMYNAQPMTIYASEQGHSSIDKAMDMLGLGKKYLRKISVKTDMTVDVSEMRRQIELDKSNGLLPIGVIGIAGGTNSGAVDDLNALADLAEANDLWFMVDAAYGGPAAKTEIVGNLFSGMERADSMLINPHKWLYVPFEVSCVLVKNKQHLSDTFSMIPDYLKSTADDGREDLMEFNLQLTKDFKALKVWMTFKAYGAENLRQAITNDIETVRYMEQLVIEASDFEMLAPAPLSIACFRYISNDQLIQEDDDQIDQLNTRLLETIEADGRIFFAGTKIHGRVSLRISCTNHRRTKSDIDFLISVLRELGSKLLN